MSSAIGVGSISWARLTHNIILNLLFNTYLVLCYIALKGFYNKIILAYCGFSWSVSLPQRRAYTAASSLSNSS